MTASLEGQVAIVTGASSGIGAAVARELARRGADVVINHSGSPGAGNESGSAARAEAVAADVEGAGRRAMVIAADVASERDVSTMFNAAVAEFGRLDILIANAGIQRDAPSVAMKLDAWQRVIDVNLTGQFLCARAAAEVFIRQGHRGVSRAAGKIVCVSSVHETVPWAGHVNYAAAKGGVLMLMRTLSLEFAADRIRVNAVAPGAIKTNINRAVWEGKDTASDVVGLIPYGRWGEPEDVARPVVWLVSDEADYITGTTLYIDGGMALCSPFSESG